MSETVKAAGYWDGHAAASQHLRPLIDQLRAERDLLNRTFCELCDELGCEYDNEAALMAIQALKQPEQ
jgi:hypothetical protein